MSIRVVRIIDRLNIGGPAKHVTWLTAGLNSGQFESTLITGTVPASEGDMNYFAREAGVEPIVIAEMSREIGPRDLIVAWKVFKELVALNRISCTLIRRKPVRSGEQLHFSTICLVLVP